MSFPNMTVDLLACLKLCLTIFAIGSFLYPNTSYLMSIKRVYVDAEIPESIGEDPIINGDQVFSYAGFQINMTECGPNFKCADPDAISQEDVVIHPWAFCSDFRPGADNSTTTPSCIPRHRHDLGELYVIHSGSLTFELNHTTQNFSAGQNVTVPPGTLHGFWNAGNEVARFSVYRSYPDGSIAHFDIEGRTDDGDYVVDVWATSRLTRMDLPFASSWQTFGTLFLHHCDYSVGFRDTLSSSNQLHFSEFDYIVGNQPMPFLLKHATKLLCTAQKLAVPTNWLVQ